MRAQRNQLRLVECGFQGTGRNEIPRARNPRKARKEVMSNYFWTLGLFLDIGLIFNPIFFSRLLFRMRVAEFLVLCLALIILLGLVPVARALSLQPLTNARIAMGVVQYMASSRIRKVALVRLIVRRVQRQARVYWRILEIGSKARNVRVTPTVVQIRYIRITPCLVRVMEALQSDDQDRPLWAAIAMDLLGDVMDSA
jgi:hypothetical protein